MESQSIKFIPVKNPPEILPTFNQVSHNQFFVDLDGNLCQKYTTSNYIIIADKNGKPHCSTGTCSSLKDVKRILPMMEKIVF